MASSSRVRRAGRRMSGSASTTAFSKTSVSVRGGVFRLLAMADGGANQFVGLAREGFLEFEDDVAQGAGNGNLDPWVWRFAEDGQFRQHLADNRPADESALIGVDIVDQVA